MRSLHFYLLILLFIGSAFPQQKADINNIRSLYESFEYKDVIRLSDSLLVSKGTINKADLIEVLMMKAVSHYALTEEDKVRKCFIEMLKIDRHIELDSEKVSPKIVSIFNDVKNDFLQVIPEEQKFIENKLETSNQPSNDVMVSSFRAQKNSIIRSFLFPGWGQIYSGNVTKGAIISSAALINIGALIYYIIDVNSKGKKYLNATDENIIKSSYDNYNRSYRMRNFLISSVITIYAYAQIDFFYLGGNGIPEIKMELGKNYTDPNQNGMAISLKIGL